MENISELEKLILEADDSDIASLLNENISKDELKKFKVISSMSETARKKIRESAQKRVAQGITDIIKIMKEGKYENL